jgi:hypothetical protein
MADDTITLPKASDKAILSFFGELEKHMALRRHLFGFKALTKMLRLKIY